VVAFNNPAMAATGKPAQTGHQNSLRRIAANKRLSGNITSGCQYANTSHWLHIAEPPGGDVVCIGNRGLLDMSPYPNMHGYCGGTNYGVIWGNGEQGWSYYTYGPGKTFAHLRAGSTWFYVSEIAVSRWTGTDKCP
jgi:hypothetical protein